MADEKQDSTVWIRWSGTIAIVVGVNFVSAAYFVGGTESKVQQGEKRLERLEADQVTRDQFNELKIDVKEIKQDVKDLGKSRR